MPLTFSQVMRAPQLMSGLRRESSHNEMGKNRYFGRQPVSADPFRGRTWPVKIKGSYGKTLNYEDIPPLPECFMR